MNYTLKNYKVDVLVRICFDLIGKYVKNTIAVCHDFKRHEKKVLHCGGRLSLESDVIS